MLLASLVWATLPRLVGMARETMDLARLRRRDRRERIFGPWYREVEALRAQLPPDEAVAILHRSQAGSDEGVFLNYYLAPRRTRLYTRNTYLLSAKDPLTPKTIVLAEEGRVRIVTLEMIRDLDLRRPVKRAAVRELPPAFSIPIAASADGADAESYVTEAVLTNPGPRAITLRLELQPQGMVKTLTIAPGETRAFYDLVYQLYEYIGVGWLRATATGPLHGGFWFVNRGTDEAAEVPPWTAFAPLHAIWQLPGGTKLWLLNPSDHPIGIRTGGEVHVVAPHALLPMAAEGRVAVESSEAAGVFASRKEGTRFFWSP